MLYNMEKHRLKKDSDCLTCPHYDKKNNLCIGMNKCCFACDPKTGIIVDGITKLPIKKI